MYRIMRGRRFWVLGLGSPRQRLPEEPSPTPQDPRRSPLADGGPKFAGTSKRDKNEKRCRKRSFVVADASTTFPLPPSTFHKPLSAERNVQILKTAEQIDRRPGPLDCPNRWRKAKKRFPGGNHTPPGKTRSERPQNPRRNGTSPFPPSAKTSKTPRKRL